jgi:hypothetical protein
MVRQGSWASVALLVACSRPAVPDPRAAVDAYAKALARGDADAVYRMMTVESRREYGLDGTRRLLSDARQELAQEGRALARAPGEIRTVATVRFVDGERAELVLERGKLCIRTADVLPYAARTPEEALASLRAALGRRSYPALVRVLSSESRSAAEQELRALVEGLENPDALDVRVRGDEAEVQVPGGHSVKLRREAGIWRVRDVD